MYSSPMFINSPPVFINHPPVNPPPEKDNKLVDSEELETIYKDAVWIHPLCLSIRPLRM
jgi:hypothetical protein